MSAKAQTVFHEYKITHFLNKTTAAPTKFRLKLNHSNTAGVK